MQTNIRRTIACQGLARLGPSSLTGNLSRSWKRAVYPCRQTSSPTWISETKAFASSSSKLRESDEVRWLIRARRYGINSMQQLLAEATISHKDPVGSKVVDNPKYRQDQRLWLLLLQVSLQTDMLRGGRAIWHAMKWRTDRVEIDAEDAVGLELLRAFVEAGTTDMQLMRQLSIDCVRSGIYLHWKTMFSDIVTAVLISNPESAMEFAVPLLKYRWINQRDLLRMAMLAYNAKDPVKVEAFYNVLSKLSNRHLYDELSRVVWDFGQPSDAFTMHEILLARRDLPSSAEILRPFIQHLACNMLELQPFLDRLNTNGINFDAQLRQLYVLKQAESTGHSPEALQFLTVANLTPRIQSLSDETVARAFATTAFSFDFILNSLCMIGLTEIGPLAARQIALTAEDATILDNRFIRLQERGVDTGSSKFVACLKRVSASGNSTLMKAIVTSDLHHDVFDDTPLQHRLLSEYHRKGDIAQLNRTLAILNIGDSGPDAQVRALNNILRTALRTDNFNDINRLVERMRQTAQWAHEGSIREIEDLLLHFEAVDRTGALSSFDHCLFLIGIIQKLMVSGTRVPLSVWRRPLLLFCGEGRLAELEKLALWLAEWYKRNGTSSRFLHARLHGRDCQLNSVFDTKFQTRLIGWSLVHGLRVFRDDGSSESGLSEDSSWLNGLRFLRKLRDKYNVDVRQATLNAVFVGRLKKTYYMTFYAKRPAPQRSILLDRVPLHLLLSSWATFWKLPEQKLWIRRTKQRIRSRPRQYDYASVGHLLKDKVTTVHQAVDEDVRGDEGRNLSGEVGDEAEGTVVGYRDLYTASWEDYQK